MVENTTFVDAHRVLRTEHIIEQHGAPMDLKLLSWPPNHPIPSAAEEFPPYRFNAGLRLNTYVYVIDQGIDFQNAVSHGT